MEQVFIDNPHLDVVYKTNDGKYFLLENDAQNHALTLDIKRVEKLLRPTATMTEAFAQALDEGQKEIPSFDESLSENDSLHEDENKNFIEEEIQEKQDINQQEDIIEEKSKKTKNKDE